MSSTKPSDKELLEMANDCLAEVEATLNGKGVPMDGCPPMFYPEAIHNLYVWTHEATRECGRKHRYHRNNKKLIGRCVVAGIKRIAKKKSSDVLRGQGRGKVKRGGP